MQAHKYEALDGLRGLCACLVALFHFHTVGAITNAPIVRQGWLFVDFFFVLSGFVIATSYGKRIAAGYSVWRFMGLRLGRIYPLHLFILAVLIAQEFVLAALNEGPLSAVTSRDPFTAGRSVDALALNIGLLHSFGFEDQLTWNGPSWSIAAEIWAYLTFAVLVAALRERALVAFALLGAIALATLIFASPGHLNATYGYGFVRCLFGFSLGVLVRPIVERSPVRAVGTPATLLELLVVAGCVGIVIIGEGMVALLAPPMFAIALLVFAKEEGGISRALKRPTMRRLGLLSYSIYMIHPFVQGRLVDVLVLAELATGADIVGPLQPSEGIRDLIMAPGLWSDLITLLMLLLVLGAASLTYRFIEHPGREWSRRMMMADRHTSKVGETVPR